MTTWRKRSVTWPQTNSGELAGYIPELAGANPERLGAVFATVDGEVYGAGDADVEFTIQSISKPFAYALALADRGFSAVLAKVGVEPSGEAFNEISLENETGRPRNPMINAGAITTHSLLGSEHLLPAERVDRVVRGLSAFAGRRLEVDETVCVSEMENAHRNLASAHMLRSHNILTGDPRDVVEGYIRQCSVLVTARDLAVMAATLANQGVNPVLVSGCTCPGRPAGAERHGHLRNVRRRRGLGNPGRHSCQERCGRRDDRSPAGQVGIATFSPRLDARQQHAGSVAV